jgi:homoserine O-succinyltransferase/O-acetyltransferase
MPIKIPDNLPAFKTLTEEGVALIGAEDARRQDIRPIKIAILNLMPEKIPTETQLARVLGSTPLQVDLTLLQTSSYTPKNTSAEHMKTFYRSWQDVRDEKFDGLVITGAPVETLPFEDVLYWPELATIMDWSTSNVFSSFNICWGAQAALYHFHDVPKYDLAGKAFGTIWHKNLSPNHPLMRGFNDAFKVPVSRHTENHREDIEKVAGLEILAESDSSGLCLLSELAKHRFYMFNHLEYDVGTLKKEYDRDVAAEKPIEVPEDYYPNDDPSMSPTNSWRSHGHLLYGNWVNYVYQNTPYDLNLISG